MLKRYLDDDLDNLTPNTRDSEVLFVITVCQYLIKCAQESINIPKEFIQNKKYDELVQLYQGALNAMAYIENNILSNGLIAGADWRDVREDLDDKTILTNACFLYQAYKLMDTLSTECETDPKYFHNQNKMKDIVNLIQTKFWNGFYFNDYPGCQKFDLLGNSLVILYGIANESQTESIFNYVTTSVGPHGIPTAETFLPPLNEKERQVMKRDAAVIWPFTNGFMLEAMLASGNQKWIDYAINEFNKWRQLDGFYEWYDIVDGHGYGRRDQGWTAALYLRVNDSIKKIMTNRENTQ